MSVTLILFLIIFVYQAVKSEIKMQKWPFRDSMAFHLMLFCRHLSNILKCCIQANLYTLDSIRVLALAIATLDSLLAIMLFSSERLLFAIIET